MTKLYISPMAQKDLLEIKKYISEELENPVAALRIVSEITRKVRYLSTFPKSGGELSSIINIDTSYRYLVCENYLAFYRFEDDAVYVDRVIYGRRDYIKTLFDNKVIDEDTDS